MDVDSEIIYQLRPVTFDYNDNPNTTQKDVVRKLRSAAQIVRNNYGV